MSGYLLRQLVTAALTANAVRPVPGYRAAIPSMAAGWLTSELAPHLLALTAADTAYSAARGRSGAGRVLAAASSAALTGLVVQSARSKAHVDRALVEALGADYRDRLSANYTDLDLSTPLRQLAMPFRVGDGEVEILKDITYDSEHGKRGLLDVYRQRDADLTRRPGAAARARRRVVDRRQGAPGHPADAAHGRPRLGVRDDQLPPQPTRPVPRPHRRREAGHRLGPRARSGVRCRPVLRRGHRRVGRRAPRGARRTDARRPGVPARVRGRGHVAAGGGAALRRLRLRRGNRGTGRDRDARPVPRAEGDVPGPRERAGGVRAGLSPAARQPGRPAVLRDPRPPRLARRRRPGPPVRHGAAWRLAGAGRVRRAARHPARLRRLPVHPLGARRPRRRPLPPLHLRRLGARPGPSR